MGRDRAKPPASGAEVEAARPIEPTTGARTFRIVPGQSQDWAGIGSDELALVCPWLEGLDPQSGLWLSALPIHDCNAFIDGDWQLTAPAELHERCYVGVFALDRLRAAPQIFRSLRDKGVSRLINLPSVSFFDGATAQTFARLAFNLDGELDFLAQARAAGFQTALCARAEAAIAVAAGPLDFVLRHRGPDAPLAIEGTDR